ncbi:SLOG family protein [Kribbella sp. NPDC059898]|uniref:SLOG family protein n=1 Tax=Kribbella sp. NPDC059898 TaxID=3346995 RepID=UPI00365EBEBA
MNSLRRILLAADRRFDDRRLLENVLTEIYRDHPHAVLVHGADTTAEQLADEVWLGTVERHPADRRHHDNNCPPTHQHRPICSRAEFRRDLEMIALGAELCISFAGPRLTTTGHSIAHLAERAGITTRCYPEAPEPARTSTTIGSMLALSIQQPWAGLIMSGAKGVENRTWQTTHRGRILVHASKQWDPHGQTLAGLLGQEVDRRTAPTGYLGHVELVDVHRDRGCCRPWGEPNVFHWVVRAPQPFAEPVAGPGRLRLFTPPGEIAALVENDPGSRPGVHA